MVSMTGGGKTRVTLSASKMMRGIGVSCSAVELWESSSGREDVHIVAAFTKPADQWATDGLCEPTA